MIVTFADAGSQPDTVVIEPQYAVVADVAVGGPRRSEYITSFTIFKLEK
jgi:hypothetical protein